MALSLHVLVKEAWYRLFGSCRAQGATTRAAAGAATKRPLVAGAGSAVVDYAEAKVLAVFFVCNLVAVANLNVLIFPASELARLALRQPSSASGVEESSGNQATTDQVNGVVMAKIHGRPPNPASIDNEERSELGEGVAHEECLKHGVGGVERRESAKWKRRRGEVGGVQVNAKDLVDTGEACGRSGHTVRCRHQAVLVLVPWRSAWEHKLNGDTENAHPTKATSKHVDCSRGGKDEEDQRANCGGSKMHDTVRQPSQDVEDGVLVRRQNVGQVCAVENVLQCRQDANPDVRSVVVVDETRLHVRLCLENH